MVNAAETKAYGITGVREILQFFFKVPIAYDGQNVCRDAAGIDADVVVVVAVYNGGIGKQFIVEDVVPAQCTRGITVTEAKEAAKAQVILPKVAGQKYAVLLAQLVIEFCVQIIKIE